ncbi:uncharacterized protein LOC113796043 [Dermatophagoides pteronyssinus]|uniref:Uncharacterized protein LOC113796043 n=2 Tax=Dermatophagoides pteronyssinus TaxID=6956 RepID=A0A6P6YBT2_DERPT|nr:uncharacterized protein LOC113796043 [Dermatophagoides pteronyssinus]KAH9421069.1 hypothetical protein DERP_001511 [Dermatophagoides pteronyssinus]
MSECIHYKTSKTMEKKSNSSNDRQSSESSLELAVIPPRPLPRMKRNAVSVIHRDYDLFSFDKKKNQKDRIIFSLLGALVLILLLFIIHSFILKPLIISTNSVPDRFSDDSWIHMDQIIRTSVEYIRHKANTSDDDEHLILMSSDLKWLKHLQLNSLNISNCYQQDDSSLFYHYCVDESQYPILYDEDCWPHSIDLYQQFIMIKNQTNVTLSDTSIIDGFVRIYHRFLNNSDGLKSIRNKQISLAFLYAKKIGRDCEHPEVWQQNFNLSLPSGRNEKELWELYCLRGIRYPNIVSINSGKYYVPEYYRQLIERDSDGKRSLDSDERWMYQWMTEKFIPLYQTNSVLQERFENELKNSRIFAKNNGLEC